MRHACRLQLAADGAAVRIAHYLECGKPAQRCRGIVLETTAELVDGALPEAMRPIRSGNEARGRGNQYQGCHKRGVTHGKLQGKHRSERPATEHGGAIEPACEGIGPAGEGRVAGRRRIAEAGQIQQTHDVASAQMVDQRRPHGCL